MKKMDIYVDVRHLNYWWGVYGFCNKTSWEDIEQMQIKMNISKEKVLEILNRYS